MSSLYEIQGQKLKTLISEEKLHQRIAELGAQITKDYEGKDLVVIGVLRGCFLFLADLVRHVDMPFVIEFLGLSSYGSRTSSSGVVRLTYDLSTPIMGRDVLIVEDIVDTGLTMNYLLANLQTRKPNSIKICSLLEKPERVIEPVDIDYLGFTIPNHFVIGYGLDFEDKHRNIPFIGYIDGLEE